jgi:PAS domain S-box-containing protein
MADSLIAVADHLLSRRDAILAHLRDMTAVDPGVPEARRLSYQQFLDDLPVMLDGLDSLLRAPTVDAAAGSNARDRPAEEHGRRRYGAGYSVDQLVREMGDLHDVLLEEIEWACRSADAVPREIAVAAARRIGRFITNGAARSAESFSRADVAAQDDARLRTILSQMPLGVLIADSEGRALHLNDAAREAIGGTTGVGKRVDELCPLYYPQIDTEIPWDETPIGRAVRGENVTDFEADVRLGEGAVRCYLFNAGPLRDRHGKVAGAVAVCQDITVRRRNEAALRAADRSKDRFLALLSHEMRNPVSAILNAVYLLHQESLTPAQHLHARNIIERNAENVAKLLEDLLDVSRITQDKVVLNRKPIRLDTVVAGVVTEMEAGANAKGIALRFDADGETWVNGDILRLTQIFSNLVGNALKYTVDGQVDVSVRHAGGVAEVTVRDTGIGMDPETLGSVFEIFAQAETARAHAGGGMGLGLALVKSFVELHGGAVTAHSDGPDKGSAFITTLPLCSPEAGS